jgi:predicted transcriptional regulator
MVNRLFKGNAQELVAALVKGNGLSSADIDELRAMFKVEGD